ncbi:hypothetical protein M0R01_00670 [bacterium]|nr:hypothetical protein [bacterium]
MEEDAHCEAKEDALKNAEFYLQQISQGRGDKLILLCFIADYIKGGILTFEEMGITAEKLSRMAQEACIDKISKLQNESVKVRSINLEIQAITLKAGNIS